MGKVGILKLRVTWVTAEKIYLAWRKMRALSQTSPVYEAGCVHIIYNYYREHYSGAN